MLPDLVPGDAVLLLRPQAFVMDQRDGYQLCDWDRAVAQYQSSSGRTSRPLANVPTVSDAVLRLQLFIADQRSGFFIDSSPRDYRAICLGGGMLPVFVACRGCESDAQITRSAVVWNKALHRI